MTNFCSFDTFWLGFKDWFWEKMHPGTGPLTTTHGKSGSLVGLLAVITIGVALTGVLAAVVTPPAAVGLANVGTRPVLYVVQTVSTLAAIGFLVGVPVWGALKSYQFSQAMCLRGQEIKRGLRKPMCLYR